MTPCHCTHIASISFYRVHGVHGVHGVSYLVGLPGSGDGFVQLTIEAMFTRGVGKKQVKAPCSATSGETRASMEEDSWRREGAEAMDTEAAENPSALDRSGPRCNVCRRELSRDKCHTCCPFCDRAACRGCSHTCSLCGALHCRLCLSTDFSSQFESYLCPACHRDRKGGMGPMLP